MTSRSVFLVTAVVFSASVVNAQIPGDGGSLAADLTLGSAGFVDDATIHHAVVGGALRWYLTPRVSVGPEVVYMRGPRDDRDLMVTGNVTFDFLSPVPDRRVMPFAVVGAGLFRHSDRVGSFAFSSNEGAFTAGGGLRVNLSDRWYVGGEARFGWELHTRVTGVVGVRLR